jgi:hypothetical protein
MLHLCGYYRLLKPTVALERTENEKKCFQVPEGSTLLVNSFEREGPLVHVAYQGHQLLMFEDDLAERTQPVEGPRLPHQLGKFVFPLDRGQPHRATVRKPT